MGVLVVKRIVLAQCGHWWEEWSSPDWVPPVGASRVCTGCPFDPRRASHVGRSPQGFAMVNVTYQQPEEVTI